MKRFLLFAGEDYYPQGGANDLIGAFDSVDEAKAAHDPNKFNYDGGWANILDVGTLVIACWFGRQVWQDGSPCDE